jgi:hypothetical protein
MYNIQGVLSAGTEMAISSKKNPRRQQVHWHLSHQYFKLNAQYTLQRTQNLNGHSLRYMFFDNDWSGPLVSQLHTAHWLQHSPPAKAKNMYLDQMRTDIKKKRRHEQGFNTHKTEQTITNNSPWSTSHVIHSEFSFSSKNSTPSCPARSGMYSIIASRTRHFESSASSTMAGNNDCDSWKCNAQHEA